MSALLVMVHMVTSVPVPINTERCNPSGCYQGCISNNCPRGDCIIGFCHCSECSHPLIPSKCDITCEQGCKKNDCNIGKCNIQGCACFDCNNTVLTIKELYIKH